MTHMLAGKVFFLFMLIKNLALQTRNVTEGSVNTATANFYQSIAIRSFISQRSMLTSPVPSEWQTITNKHLSSKVSIHY